MGNAPKEVDGRNHRETKGEKKNPFVYEFRAMFNVYFWPLEKK